MTTATIKFKTEFGDYSITLTTAPDKDKEADIAFARIMLTTAITQCRIETTEVTYDEQG